MLDQQPQHMYTSSLRPRDLNTLPLNTPPTNLNLPPANLNPSGSSLTMAGFTMAFALVLATCTCANTNDLSFAAVEVVFIGSDLSKD